MRPHRHPHTFELLLPLRGRFVVLNFDDRGTVTHRAILGETCTVAGDGRRNWHAVLSLDTGGIIFEVKHGGYQPVAADDYAHWAPAKENQEPRSLWPGMAQAQVGDSTLPSKAINKKRNEFPHSFPLITNRRWTILAADA